MVLNLSCQSPRRGESATTANVQQIRTLACTTQSMPHGNGCHWGSIDVCISIMLCRYNYKKDTNRVYQKVVAEIWLASQGSSGVKQVQAAMCEWVRQQEENSPPAALPHADKMCQAESASVHVQAGSSSMQGIVSQGCTPLRPSYVTDLRGRTLKGNTTLAPADNNTTRKVSHNFDFRAT